MKNARKFLFATAILLSAIAAACAPSSGTHVEESSSGSARLAKQEKVALVEQIRKIAAAHDMALYRSEAASIGQRRETLFISLTPVGSKSNIPCLVVSDIASPDTTKYMLYRDCFNRKEAYERFKNDFDVAWSSLTKNEQS